MSPPTRNGAALLDQFREYRRTGDRRIRNELIEHYRHVADHYARRYRDRGASVDDLRQTGLLAMIRAVDRFDPEMGVDFATFASRTVDGELKRWLRDRTWAVRPPRSSQERHLALRQAEDALLQKLGRSPTVQELAGAMGTSEDDVLDALEAGAARSAAPITPPSPDDDRTADDVLPGELAIGYGRVDDRLLVSHLLEALNERDRAVIEMRFFEGLGQEEIAQRIGVSQSYLSRMLRRILLDLRSHLATDTPAE